MQIKPLDEKVLAEAAQKAFPDQYIQLDTSDIFLKGKQAGRYQAPWLDHEFYVSTEYAYEDRIVNGNKTRYKIAMPCILCKTDPYEIIYDLQDHYYVAYEEAGLIQFAKYTTLLAELVEQMELLEALTPV